MSLQSTVSDTVLYLRPSSPSMAAADPLCKDFKDAYEAMAHDIARRAASEGKIGKRLAGGISGEFEIQLSEWRAALSEAKLQLSQTPKHEPGLSLTPDSTSSTESDSKRTENDEPASCLEKKLVDHAQELRTNADENPSSRHSSSSLKTERYDRPAPMGHVPAQTAHVLWIGNLVQSTTLSQLRDVLFGDIPSAHHLRSVIHLPQSKCAFANYSSDKAMKRALAVFNGRMLSRGDHQEPIILICKIRKPEEIEKGPHQKGIHKLGIQNGPGHKVSAAASIKLQEHPSLSSMSTASTTSTFLTKHFPTRYFILKSRSVSELEKAAETNRWRPQLHNETMLRRAHRCGEVIIIFSANGTGSFWGVARMAGSLDRGKSGQSELAFEQSDGKTASVPLPTKDERDELWKRHTVLPSMPKPKDAESEEGGSPTKTKPPLLRLPSDNPSLSASPIQLSPYEEKPRLHLTSSPINSSAEEPIRRDFLEPTLQPKIVDPSLEEFDEALGMDRPRGCHENLDDNIPPPGIIGEVGKGLFWEREHHPDDMPMSPPLAETVADMALATPFPLEWLFTTPLPFAHVRGLRNPWNGNKEVKVARDGIEVEPSVGRQLLGAFWNNHSRPKESSAQNSFSWRSDELTSPQHSQQQYSQIPRSHAPVPSGLVNGTTAWHQSYGPPYALPQPHLYRGPDSQTYFLDATSPTLPSYGSATSTGPSYSPVSTMTAPTPDFRFDSHDLRSHDPAWGRIPNSQDYQRAPQAANHYHPGHVPKY